MRPDRGRAPAVAPAGRCGRNTVPDRQGWRARACRRPRAPERAQGQQHVAVGARQVAGAELAPHAVSPGFGRHGSAVPRLSRGRAGQRTGRTIPFPISGLAERCRMGDAAVVTRAAIPGLGRASWSRPRAASAFQGWAVLSSDSRRRSPQHQPVTNGRVRSSTAPLGCLYALRRRCVRVRHRFNAYPPCRASHSASAASMMA